MLDHGDKVLVKIGNGAVNVPGIIVCTSTDNTYSVKVKLHSGKERVLHKIPRADIIFVESSEVVL